MTLKHRLPRLGYVLAACAALALPVLPDTAYAQATEVASERAPTLEERVADLESSRNNVPRPTQAATNKEKITTMVPGPDPGHNGWQMVSTAAVLFMTLPGLALFYGGLVRRKNVLSVLAQCLGCACVITPLWWLCGFSFSFGSGTGGLAPFLGGTEYTMFKGILPSATGIGSVGISDSVFAMFQLTFAIITPALIVGAIAERMKFSAIMAFIVAWMFFVYFPFAHMVWSGTGFMSALMNKGASIKAIDFAGGTVVHMTSGWSALVLCLILGKRRHFGKEPMAPHSMVLCMVGTGMLWVGWYGFNAGSALAADTIASNAFMTTTLCAATAGLFWAIAERIFRGKVSVLGFCSGIVAGLVVITPACGFVTSTSSVIMGIIAGIVPFFAVSYLKKWLGYDDALDTFGVHGVGGTLGALLTGVFASKEVNPVIEPFLPGLFMEQVKAVGVTIIWSVVATALIAFIIKAVMGLRPTAEDEETGLDLVDHGEQGYEG